MLDSLTDPGNRFDSKMAAARIARTGWDRERRAGAGFWDQSFTRMARHVQRLGKDRDGTEFQWDGELTSGSGYVAAASGAFASSVTFPRVSGEPPGQTTPEELLAASHATCYGIGLRSLIGQRGGRARRVTVDATITAEKGGGGIRIQASHLTAVVEALEGLEQAQLEDIAREVAEECTISIAVRDTVRITHEIKVERLAEP